MSFALPTVILYCSGAIIGGTPGSYAGDESFGDRNVSHPLFATLPERCEGIRFSHSRKTLVRYVTKRSNYLSRRWKLVCLRRAVHGVLFTEMIPPVFPNGMCWMWQDSFIKSARSASCYNTATKNSIKKSLKHEALSVSSSARVDQQSKHAILPSKRVHSRCGFDEY